MALRGNPHRMCLSLTTNDICATAHAKHTNNVSLKTLQNRVRETHPPTLCFPNRWVVLHQIATTCATQNIWDKCLDAMKHMRQHNIRNVHSQKEPPNGWVIDAKHVDLDITLVYYWNDTRKYSTIPKICIQTETTGTSKQPRPIGLHNTPPNNCESHHHHE